MWPIILVGKAVIKSMGGPENAHLGDSPLLTLLFTSSPETLYTWRQKLEQACFNWRVGGISYLQPSLSRFIAAFSLGAFPLYLCNRVVSPWMVMLYCRRHLCWLSIFFIACNCAAVIRLHVLQVFTDFCSAVTMFVIWSESPATCIHVVDSSKVQNRLE